MSEVPLYLEDVGEHGEARQTQYGTKYIMDAFIAISKHLSQPPGKHGCFYLEKREFFIDNILALIHLIIEMT